MKKLILLSSICFIFWACGNNEDPKSKAYDQSNLSADEQLYKEVIEGHDVGMAKINTINKTKAQLVRMLDSIETNKVKISAEMKAGLNKAIADLDEANKAMFKWMEEFKVDSAADDVKKRIAYLTSEKVSVTIVKDKILNGLAYADSVTAAFLSKKLD